MYRGHVARQRICNVCRKLSIVYHTDRRALSVHYVVADNSREQHQPVNLPLPEPRGLAAVANNLLPDGVLPPASLAQFPPSLPAPPRVSNLLPPPPRVGSQSAGVDMQNRDGVGGGSALQHDFAVTHMQESRLGFGLVRGDWLPPRQSQRDKRGRQTDRPSYGRVGRPPPHRGFGHQSASDKWRNRHSVHRDRGYPPRRHRQQVSDESTRYDDEVEGDEWQADDVVSDDQLPGNDTSLPPEAELRSETQLQSGDDV